MVQHVEHWATVATISNRYALLVSNLFVEAYASFLDLPPSHHVPFTGS
jgi:hypothetical protein